MPVRWEPLLNDNFLSQLEEQEEQLPPEQEEQPPPVPATALETPRSLELIE
jgi:hypothetical protein